MNPEQPAPLPDDRRPKAPPNPQAEEAEGPPEPAGARYALAIPTPPVRLGRTPEDGPLPGTERGPSAGVAVVNHVAVRKRTYRPTRRGRIVMLRFDELEYDRVRKAAEEAKLTMSGYAAVAALAAANQEAPPSATPLRTALAELIAARTQVRRYAVNVNQAVTVLHATGEPPLWLEDAIAMTTRAVFRVDVAAALVARALR